MTCSDSKTYLQEQWQQDYPERLWRGERPIDSKFDQIELLYRRFPKYWFNEQENKVLPLAFSLPNCSVNRDKYSKFEDVLCHRASCPKHNCQNWGVASFKVEDIPPYISSNNENFSFRVMHDPLEYNYSHSEIRAYQHSQDQESRDISKSTLKKFRTALYGKARVLKSPRD